MANVTRKTVFGTEAGDTLAGTDAADTIYGFDGNDTITGAGGDDHLFGGVGDDTLYGDDPGPGTGGNDVLFGGDGDDALYGGVGRNTLFGGDGNDLMHIGVPGTLAIVTSGRADGGDGDDRIFGGPGDHVLLGGAGNDVLSDAEGNDRLFGGAGDDQLFGNVVFAAVGVAQLFGGDGNDLLSGSFATPSMYGGEGDDVLRLGAFDPNFDTAPDRPWDFDGGTGIDILDVSRRSSLESPITLSADDNVIGIERIDLGSASLALDAAGVLGASDETDTLFVQSEPGARIDAAGAWQAAGTQTVDGVAYAGWTLDGATLFVDSDVTFLIA